MEGSNDKQRHIRNYGKAVKLAEKEFKEWEKPRVRWNDETDEQYERRVKEHVKALAKHKKVWTGRLGRADKAGRLREIEATVAWSKSRGAYGYQCRAEVWVTWDDPEYGTRSSHIVGPRTNGCGYDKVSTALSEAFNALDGNGLGALDRMVIEAGERVWTEYAIDRTPIPHFEFAGKGTSTFLGLFHCLGRKRYANDKFAFPKFEIDYRQNWDTEDWTIHVIRKDII